MLVNGSGAHRAGSLLSCLLTDVHHFLYHAMAMVPLQGDWTSVHCCDAPLEVGDLFREVFGRFDDVVAGLALLFTAEAGSMIFAATRFVALPLPVRFYALKSCHKSRLILGSSLVLKDVTHQVLRYALPLSTKAQSRALQD
jgi:hypothetical protein